MVTFLRRHLQRWALRRQGRDPASTELRPGRIYILPTRVGLIFGLVLLTMLVGALNYSNNMGFALTFLLIALGIVSLLHCQRNLAGLRVDVGGLRAVFAGDAMECELHLGNRSGRTRWQIAAGPDRDETPAIDLAPGATGSLKLLLPMPVRGRFECPAIRLSTTYPLGLCRAWVWLHPGLELLAYPRPADQLTAPREDAGSEAASAAGETIRGDEEFVGLRAPLPGESPARIAWKALARTGDVLAKDYRSGSPSVWLDWDDLPVADPEVRLSLLTRLALEQEARGRTFGLGLPGHSVPPASGQEHLHRCLALLACFDPHDGADRPC